MRVGAVCFAIVAMSVSAHADSATAGAAFRQAEALGKQGKWGEACPLFEASFHADPQLGVLLYLADCHERIGRTASAFGEFNDAVDMARSRSDAKREAVARKRADALEPKLAKLTLVAPRKLIPGLVVKRGNVDITALVGSPIPIDPGPHQLVASGPGYVDWKHDITIAPSSSSSIDIPSLEKIVDKPASAPEPVVHEGTLKITTLATAEIILDNERVGVGTYEGKVKSGGHTLRIVAGGKRPYQSEVVVGDNELRTIDVPLENEVVASRVIVMNQPPHAEDRPSFEVAASMQSGVKVRGDSPLVVAVRGEVALRLGRRVNFGLFVEYGGIDTGGSCGFDMPGPMPETPLDFGPRNQFTKCTYLLPGLQLYVHVLPKGRFDPYIGISPAFRFGFTEWTEYVGGVPQNRQSELFPAIVSGVRAGLDYHPRPGLFGWAFGAYVEGAITFAGQEAGGDSNMDGSTEAFVNLFGGVRTSRAF